VLPTTQAVANSVVRMPCSAFVMACYAALCSTMYTRVHLLLGWCWVQVEVNASSSSTLLWHLHMQLLQQLYLCTWGLHRKMQ
jgi:uncharacterized membrane protein